MKVKTDIKAGISIVTSGVDSTNTGNGTGNNNNNSNNGGIIVNS
jgi:hypothetical protein